MQSTKQEWGQGLHVLLLYVRTFVIKSTTCRYQVWIVKTTHGHCPIPKPQKQVQYFSTHAHTTVVVLAESLFFRWCSRAKKFGDVQHAMVGGAQICAFQDRGTKKQGKQKKLVKATTTTKQPTKQPTNHPSTNHPTNQAKTNQPFKPLTTQQSNCHVSVTPLCRFEP